MNAYQVLDCRFEHQIVALKKGMQPIQFSGSMMHLDSLENFDNVLRPTPKKIDTALPKKLDTNVPKSGPPQPLVLAPKSPLPSAEKTSSTIDSKSKAKTKPKSTLKTNNKTNNKSLNIEKKSAKAVMPKKTDAKTTNN